MITNYNKFNISESIYSETGYATEKLEESSYFHEKYKFDCILITINDVEEATKAHKIVYDFCEHYDIGSERVYDFFDNIIYSNSLRSPIYIRLIINTYDNVLILSWGRMSNFENNQETSNYSYEKFFTINDLERGLLDNIKKYGISALPSYIPKKTYRTLESKETPISEAERYWPYRFKTREEFVQDYGTGWSTRIQYVNPEVGVSWAREMNYLLGKPCQIEGIDMSQNQRYRLDTDKTERGYWIITNEMLVKNRLSEPSYEPRRINRTLERVTWYPYRVKTEKEMIDTFGLAWKRAIGDIVGWDNEMLELLGEPYPKENFKIEEHNDDDWLEIHGKSSRIWTITPLMLTKNTPKPPSYVPKKTVRTLENVNENFRFFYDNKQLEHESNKSKFKIGDIVTIRPNGLEIHLSKIDGIYNELDNTKVWIVGKVGKKLTVIDLGLSDEGLWVINCKDEKGEFNYVQQDALMKYGPSYEPRRIYKSI